MMEMPKILQEIEQHEKEFKEVSLSRRELRQMISFLKEMANALEILVEERRNQLNPNLLRALDRFKEWK